MKFCQYFCLGLIILLNIFCGCTKAKRPTQLFLMPAFKPCELPQVQSCKQECEIVAASQNTAIAQELATGLNLSNFNIAVCGGQYSPIYMCFLVKAGNNACSMIKDIIQNDTYKLVLENPDCQCTLLYT